MKFVQVSYTILETIEVEDDITADGVEELLEQDMWEKGIYNIVNDIEWQYAD